MAKKTKAQRDLEASSDYYVAGARPIVVPRSTRPPRGGRPSAAQDLMDLGEDLKRKARELKRQQARDRTSLDRQAKIWAGEQLVQPWEVPRPPKKKEKPKTFAETMQPSKYLTPRERAQRERQQLRAAQMAVISSQARRKLATLATPERQKQMRQRPVPAQAKPSALQKDWKKFWEGNPLEGAEALVSGGYHLATRGAQEQGDLWGPIVRDIYEKTFDPDERAHLEKLQADAMQTGLHGGEFVGKALGGRARKNISTNLQAAGLGSEQADAIAGVVDKFIQNVSTGVIGLGPGGVALATHPVRMGGEIGAFYGDFYEPLIRGDVDQFRKNLAENPDMALDWLGAIGLITAPVRRANIITRAARGAETVGETPGRAAVKAAITGKEPMPIPKLTEEGELARTLEGDIEVEHVWGRPTNVRTLKTREGRFGPVIDTGIQQYTARGPIARAAGRGWDWAANIVTPTRSRKVRKGIAEATEASRGRIFAELQGYRQAARRVQKDPAQAKAFDRMLIYGGDAAKVIGDITQELRRRDQEGLTETPGHQDEIARLNEAALYLQNPSDDFLQVVDAGRRIAQETEDHLVNAGLLHPKTAERMKLLPARFLEDVPEVVSPFRDDMIGVLRELGWDEEHILSGLSWLDSNAISWARRTGADNPGAFYETLYKDVQAAKTEDLSNMLDQADDVLAQYRQEGEAVPMDFDRTNEEVARHAKANEELTAGDPEALAKGTPKLNHPAKEIKSTEQQVARIQAGGEQAMREASRWYADIWPEFTRIFGEDGERAVRSFLMSQVAMSPQDGVLAMLKVLEYKHIHGTWPEGGMLSHRTAEIVNAWVNDHMGVNPAGIAAKIADFFSSAYGQETRAWLNNITGSAPGVVDRWTLRSLGFWDENSYAYLTGLGIDAPNPKVLDDVNKRLRVLEKKRRRTPAEEAKMAELTARAKELRVELNEFYDISSGPDAYQYEWGSIRLNQLRQHANTMDNGKGLFGKNDWSVDEIQAMDWFATRAEWGEMGGGWQETWARNTYDVIGEVVGETTKDWLAEGARGAIVQDVTTNGSHGKVTLLGTPTQAEGMARRLADETGRRSYMFYDYGVSPLHRAKSPLRPRAAKTLQRRRGLDVAGDPDMIMAVLRDRMGGWMEDGLLALPYGDGRIRIMFTDVDGNLKRGKKYSAAARDALVDELNGLGVEATKVDAIMDVAHARQKPALSLYRGDDPRGVLARAAAARRRRTGFRVAPVLDEAQAAGFVDSLQRNSRAWSLSPRVADDFTADGGYRGFLTDDGNAGAAISPDGEIVSVFNSKSFPGAGGHVLVEALANGGYWLNAFDGFLPAYYANLGFREVGRLKFTEEFAPPGWTYEHGRPDIVLMAYQPHLPIRRGPYYKNPDTAEAAAMKAGKEGLAQRSVDSILEELADRGDGLAHVDANGNTLAQWKRTVKFEEGDPVIAGLVRITDDGVELRLSNAANFSTLVHENAHAMMRGTLEWLQLSEDPRLPELLRGLGIKSVDEPYSQMAQELFARLVEQRAYMNNPPAPQVRRMLASSNQAMREAYRGGIRTIKDTPAQGNKIEELMKSPAFSSLLDELIDVTYGTTRSADAVFMPRLPPTAPSKITRIIQAITGSQTRAAITPPRKGPVARGRSSYKRTESGEYRYGPDVVADYATATFRWQLGEDLGREIHRSPLAKEIELDVDGAPVFLENHVPFVYRNVPGAMRRLDQALGQAETEIDVRAARHADVEYEPDFVYDMEPHEAAEIIHEAVQSVLREDVLPRNLNSLDPYALEEMLATRAVVQIPKKLAQDYFDAVSGGTLMSMGAKHISRDINPLLKLPLAILGGLNFFQRWSMIGKGAYVTTNTVGAALTATAHNPFWVGEIKKAADFASSWSPQSLHIVDEMVGSGNFDVALLLDEARKAEMSPLERVSYAERQAYVKTVEKISLPERRIRRALMLRELHAGGITTEARFRALVEAAKVDDHWRMVFNQMARHAEDGAIRFRGMSNTEQAIVRRAFFVYGWLRASFKYTARFPLEHPVLAASMNRLGNEGWDLLQDELEKEIGLRGGIVTDLLGEAGDRVAKMIDISSVLPMGAGVQTTRALAAVPLGLFGHEKKDWDTISDMFTPGVTAGLAFAFGETPEGLKPGKIVEGYGPAKGFTGVPALSWLMRWADPSYTETTTFAKGDRLDVSMSFLFGQLWPRGTKVDAAHEVYLRNAPKSISAPIRAQTELNDLLDKYSQANRMSGDLETQEWTLAAQAHAAYDLTSDLKDSEWNDLPKAERDTKRTIVRARVLQEFYPEIWDGLVDDGLVVLDKKTKKITALDPDVVNAEYTAWVSDQWSSMRKYIRSELGEDVFDAADED